MSQLPIPAAALANHIAILGKTGSGKSNAAKVIVEHLMDRKERVCAIDPTGTWWGLRLNGTGKGASPYPIAIFGGQHADMQIGPNHGAAIAEAIGTSSSPAIIDTRLMKVSERTRFFTGFAETLLQKNSGPLHLVIDEAHVFMPQGKIPDPQAGQMLHAANNLVSLGRGIGLRIILISQRPAKVHKDSLTQVETLVALRLIAPQDRRAIEDWIGEWADKSDGADVLKSLPSLKTGDAWIWAPELDVLKRERFPLAGTFDSGKAPKGGTGPKLGSIDLSALRTKLSTVEEEAKANDPKALQAEVARLTRELAKKAMFISSSSNESEKTNTHSKAELAAARAEGFSEGFAQGHKAGFGDGIGYAHGAALVTAKALGEQAKRAAELIRSAPYVSRAVTKSFTSAKASGFPKTAAQDKPIPKSGEKYAEPMRAAAASNPAGGSNGPLKPALQKALNAIAWWRKIGFDPVERNRAAVVAGYSPRASTFGVYLAELSQQGLIVVTPGKVALSEAGLAVALTPEAATEEDLKRLASSLLKPQERRVFDAIYEAWPDEIHRHKVAEAVGLSPTASTCGVYIAAVAAYGIVEPSSPGHVRAADWLFPMASA